MGRLNLIVSYYSGGYWIHSLLHSLCASLKVISTIDRYIHSMRGLREYETAYFNGWQRWNLQRTEKRQMTWNKWNSRIVLGTRLYTSNSDASLVRKSSLSCIFHYHRGDRRRIVCVRTLLKIKYNNGRLISCHKFSFPCPVGVMRVVKLNMNHVKSRDPLVF